MNVVFAAVGCLGHLVLMIGSHNWIYGREVSKKGNKLNHLVHLLLVLALPVLLFQYFDLSLAGLTDWPAPSTGQQLLQAYLALCVLVAVVWLPALTAWRNLRREPVTEVRVEVFDVARELGRSLVGNGHQAFLAYLPRNEIFQVEFVHKTLALPRLPAAWEGLTILHLSDLHFHGTPERDWFRWIADRCATLEPDVLALTGDIADSDIHHRWIIPILGRLRWRLAAYAILGNHDHRQEPEPIRRRLRRLGMRLPGNGWLSDTLRGEPVTVIGHEGPWLPGEPDLSGCPTGPFRLCLSHTPDHIAWAQRARMDLMLSGHVHGGQIRIPPFGSVLMPSRYGRRYDHGAFQVGETLLHVNRGLSGEHPVRYACRPEVTLLTLRKGMS